MPDVTARDFKDRVFSELERIGKAVGNRRRLELLDVVSQGPHTVEELADEIGVSVASASQHLQKLSRAHLVSRRREGSHVYYRVANDEVADFYARLRRLAERQLPEVELAVGEHFGEKALQGEKADEALDQVRRGEAVLVDTRPRGEYDSGHVEDAVSIPVDELDERLDELPRDRRIIAYCRGPFCSFANRAVEKLRDEGFDAARLDLGVADFRRIGEKIEAA